MTFTWLETGPIANTDLLTSTVLIRSTLSEIVPDSSLVVGPVTSILSSTGPIISFDILVPGINGRLTLNPVEPSGSKVIGSVEVPLRDTGPEELTSFGDTLRRRSAFQIWHIADADVYFEREIIDITVDNSVSFTNNTTKNRVVSRTIASSVSINNQTTSRISLPRRVVPQFTNSIIIRNISNMVLRVGLIQPVRDEYTIAISPGRIITLPKNSVNGSYLDTLESRGLIKTTNVYTE